MKDTGPCCVCKAPIWIPDSLYDAANHSSRVTFYCSYGHAQCFAQGETDEQKLRRERDRLAQQIAQRDDEIKRQREMREGVERQLSAQRGVVTRIKNRVGHGVCPCCSRTFQDLQRHMKTKHSDYAKSELQAAE